MSILQEDDFKAKVPVYNSIAWGLLEASVEQAEEDHLLPILGQTTYDALVAANGTFTGIYAPLYAKLKAPLAQMVAYLAVPDLDVNLGTRGFTVRKTEDESPASQARVQSFRLSQLRKAMSGFDKLLAWLETNKATYTAWASSTAYTELKQGFVNTTTEFQEYVDINNSRHLFMRLRPFRTKVERTELKSYLGEALYAEIKAQILAGTVSADNTLLLPMIREAVSARAITQGIVGLSLEVSEQGFLVHGTQESTTMNMKKQTVDNHIDAMVRQYNQDADNAFGALRIYLNANATAIKYAVYFTSELYVDPAGSDPNEDQYRNNADSSVFIF